MSWAHAVRMLSEQEMEALVQEGRNSILQEHTRQRRVRERNLAKLEETLLALERTYAEEVDKRIEEEQRALQEVSRDGGDDAGRRRWGVGSLTLTDMNPSL